MNTSATLGTWVRDFLHYLLWPIPQIQPRGSLGWGCRVHACRTFRLPGPYGRSGGTNSYTLFETCLHQIRKHRMPVRWARLGALTTLHSLPLLPFPGFCHLWACLGGQSLTVLWWASLPATPLCAHLSACLPTACHLLLLPPLEVPAGVLRLAGCMEAPGILHGLLLCQFRFVACHRQEVGLLWVPDTPATTDACTFWEDLEVPYKAVLPTYKHFTVWEEHHLPTT